jgi:hypothetical protein
MFSHTLICTIKDVPDQFRTLKQEACEQFKRQKILPADVPVPGGNILVGDP